MMRALMTKTLVVLSILLSAQALAFESGGFRYTVIGGSNNVEVNGRASDNIDTNIVIPATASDGTRTHSVTSIGFTAFSESFLESVIIPDSVTRIWDAAFRDNNLTSVVIPNSVTIVSYEAFASNILTSVIIPDSVITIGDGAFVANALTSAAFEVDFGLFSLDMFFFNDDLATITYCDARTGWPQGFTNGSTTIVTEPVNCSIDGDGDGSADVDDNCSFMLS